MKNFKIAVAAAALAVSVVSCTTAQLTSFTGFATTYSQRLDNFDAAANAANVDIIARTSKTLANYCSAVIQVGKDIKSLARDTPSANTGLSTATAAITNYCTNLPTDISSAITAVSGSLVAARDAYAQAKAGG